MLTKLEKELIFGEHNTRLIAVIIQVVGMRMDQGH